MAIERHRMFATLVVRSLLNNARISAWTLLTLAACAALVTIFTTAAFEVGGKMTAAVRQVGANAVAYPAGGVRSDWTAFATVTHTDGIDNAVVGVRVGLIEGKAVAIAAAEPHALQRLTPYWAVTGRRPATPEECVVGQRVAAALDLKPGKRMSVEWPDRSASSSFIVAGIMETGDEDDDRVFVSGPMARDEFRYALVSAAGRETQIDRLAQALDAAGAGIAIKPLRQILHGEQHILDKVNLLCAVALGAVLVLTALGVSASMLARVVERRKEFALLQALGAQRRAVVGFLLAESATLGVVAAMVGFGIGTASAALVLRQIFNAAVAPHGIAGLAALATTTLVALTAGGIAASRTLRFQPAAALRGE